MAEMFCSRSALASQLPAFDFTPPEYVELRLLYNPFKPETVELHELEYQEGKFLSAYLEGLPDDAEWMVFFNGQEISLDVASITPVVKGDRIGLIMLPLGGDGLKSVLRIVMMGAMMAIPFLNISIVAAVAIGMGLGLVSALLLTPKPPKPQKEDENSYGIDGAKNSATEGIPYPVVYGDFRVAGNFSDCFTENVGDNQYLYIRSVLNDGLIDSVSDIEINEQPLSSFRDIQHKISLGSLTEDVNPWFRSSIRQINKAVKLDTTWTSHITEEAVDMVRFDLVFPAGLVQIDKKKGKHLTHSIMVQMDYRQVVKNPTTGAWEPIGDGSFSTLPHQVPSEYPNSSGSTFVDSVFGLKATVVAKAPKQQAAIGSPAIEYKTASGDWSSLGIIDSVGLGKDVYDTSGDGSVAGPTNITPYVTKEFEVDLPDEAVQFRGVGGAIISEVTTYPRTGSQSVRVADQRTRAIRRSFTSERLNRGYYECRIRRTTPTSTDQYIIDEVHLTDVTEIELDPVAMRGTANLSLRIKLTDQLSSIPQVTARVKGSVVQKYDIDGNPTVKEWSDNPAWLGLDVLLSEERGALMPRSRIDWPRWLEFAQYCQDNNITFNGVFDSGSNIGDALRQILRIGHATPVPFGTRISVAIDRPRKPVALFTQGGVVEKSFEVSYISMQDRSNEFEVTYYDKLDRNKAKTIRYVDPKAVLFNEMPRTANVSLVGVDNIEQARIELWRMIYQNRLLVRTISFESFMESINLSIGEVALIQHDQMQWAYNGRTGPNSTTTTVQLDQFVEMEAGQSHSALVHFSTVSRGTASINSIVGNKVLIPHSAISNPGAPRITRVITNENQEDYEVLQIVPGAVYDTVVVERPVKSVLSGSQLLLVDTDVIEERAVSSVTQNADGTTTLNLASALPDAPAVYSNFVFGRVEKVRKPYTLTGISGSGIEKRRLTFMEYHEGVYGPPEVEIPIPVQRVSDRNVAHVSDLLFDYERLVSADRTVNNVRIYWNADGIVNYGGADIYMRLNGSAWSPIGSAVNVTEYTIQLAPDDAAEFKVVAYTTRGDRAPYKTAPEVAGDLAVVYAEVDAPVMLTATPIAFDVNGTVEFAWTPPADTTGIIAYELEYKRDADTTWIYVGRFAEGPVRVPGFPTGNWDARVRSVSANTVSPYMTADFTVTVVPGSVLANFNASNDRNGAPISAPTLPVAAPVEHTVNTDGSANITFEWEWDGTESTIDGFRIKVIEADL